MQEALGNATPIDRVWERIKKTPLWDEVGDAYDADQECIRVRYCFSNGPSLDLRRSRSTAHLLARMGAWPTSCPVNKSRRFCFRPI